jgi:hypothetical protein
LSAYQPINSPITHAVLVGVEKAAILQATRPLPSYRRYRRIHPGIVKSCCTFAFAVLSNKASRSLSVSFFLQLTAALLHLVHSGLDLDARNATTLTLAVIESHPALHHCIETQELQAESLVPLPNVSLICHGLPIPSNSDLQQHSWTGPRLPGPCVEAPERRYGTAYANSQRRSLSQVAGLSQRADVDLCETTKAEKKTGEKRAKRKAKRKPQGNSSSGGTRLHQPICRHSPIIKINRDIAG